MHAHLLHTATTTLYLALLALPGYWAGVALIDRVGRRPLLLAGWALMAASYVVMGAVLPVLQRYDALFYVLYGLSFFFCNMGPNVVTFVVPSELFPTSIRATCHGVSAATGKVGAVLGGALMPVLLDAWGLSAVLYVSAAISVCGFALSWRFVPETKHINLDLIHLHRTTTTTHAHGADFELAREDSPPPLANTHHHQRRDSADTELAALPPPLPAVSAAAHATVTVGLQPASAGVDALGPRPLIVLSKPPADDNRDRKPSQ